jgi:dTDP-4-amino-4,6-dideoxygalactose transaminase
MMNNSTLAHDVAAGPCSHVPRRDFLPFCVPAIDEEEIAAVIDTLRSPWISTGPKTQRLQSEFAAYVGAQSAAAVNSGTAALHTALAALGVGPGDEVITTTMTFASTVNVIEHVGAQPRLVDVEPDTLNLSAAAVERALTPRTRAIVPVHFAGHPVDMDPLLELARSRGIEIVEDAAHALPARYRGRCVGAGPNPVCFSFYATKNMTTAEGGMVTGSPEFIDAARIFSLHGMSREAWQRYDRNGSWYYEIVLPGFKYNMTDIQASLGLCQLRKLEAFAVRRRAIVARYNAAFAGDSLETPVERADVESAWHLYVLRLRPEQLRIDRNRFIVELKTRNIGTSVHFIPVHRHPYYAQKLGLAPGDLPVANAAFERMLSLPLHPRLSDSDVDDVIGAVLDVVRTFRR